MGKFFIGLLIGIFLVPTAFYLYLRSGDAPVATSAKPMPMERFLARTAMHASIDRQEQPVHLTVDNTTLVAGAHVYRQDCAVCHGLPGQPATAVAAGMFPRPPQFFRPDARKIDDPAGEVYWKVSNGIRLTGMPGFRRSLNDAKILDLTGFLENTTTLPPAAMAVLKPEAAKQDSAAGRHAKMQHNGA